MRLGLAVAAVAGLVSYIVLSLGSEVLQGAVVTFAFGRKWQSPPLGIVILYLSFGLPIALVLSLTVGFPIWKRAEARSDRSRRSALIMGATTAAVIGLLLTFLNLLAGLPYYLTDSTYNEYFHGYQVSKDGLPTLLGWFFVLLNFIYLAVAGSIGGLTARCIALPAALKRQSRQMAYS